MTPAAPTPDPALAGRDPAEAVLLSTRPGFAFVLVYRQGWWLGPPNRTAIWARVPRTTSPRLIRPFR